MRELLDRCSDMELHFADNKIIKANAFTMVMSCALLRDMYENFGEISTVRVPFEDIEAIEYAVDIIHGIKKINEISITDVESCFRGLEYLGCTAYDKKLTSRLWHLVSRASDRSVFFKFADKLLASEQHSRDFLNKLKNVCPAWNEFKDVFNHIRLSEDMAVFLMWRLCRFYPATLVFDSLFDAFPESLLTLDTSLRILGSYRTGIHYHPDEIVMSMKKILSRFDDASHVRAVCDAFCRYETSPRSKLTATTLTFQNEPRTSVLVKMYDPYNGSRTLRVKPFLIVTANTVDGTLTGTIDIDKFEDMQFCPSTILVRIMTYRSDIPWSIDVIDKSYTSTETWREYKDVDYGDHIVDIDDPTCRDQCGEEALANALKDVYLRYIRLDFFYGHGDVRKLALF